ncbi:hypothetical protein AEB_P2475 [Altererythrobacter sp. B11]|nr:sugar phosphate isomerase/epimerase [Altererythrobacter sp. B11]BBC73343.1 hypothetical protein AEB_P2475 [Altererythrobacter sp. B11]
MTTSWPYDVQVPAVVEMTFKNRSQLAGFDRSLDAEIWKTRNAQSRQSHFLQRINRIDGCASGNVAHRQVPRCEWPRIILRFIEKILPVVEQRGLRLALYPHLHHVTQTTTQVVRICERFRHPLLGASFNAYHWYGAQEGQLEHRLEAMDPWLMQVVTSGSALSRLG